MADRIQQVTRQSLKRIRAKISPAYHNQASNLICGRIKRLKAFRYAKKIALYHAVNREISLEMIWQSAPLQGKYCYFPAINEAGSLSFLPANPATSNTINEYGIPEPSVPLSDAIAVNELDIIFVPLVAFDSSANRLGMGAGYYDKALANATTPLLIGVAYQFQCVDRIKAHPQDIPLNAIITERQIYDSERLLVPFP